MVVAIGKGRDLFNGYGVSDLHQKDVKKSEHLFYNHVNVLLNTTVHLKTAKMVNGTCFSLR